MYIRDHLGYEICDVTEQGVVLVRIRDGVGADS